MMKRMLRRSLLILAAFTLLAPTAGLGQDPEPTRSSCVACHSELDDELGEPAVRWAADVHAAAGLGCDGCHGGDPSPDLADDPEAAMDPAKGFRSLPGRLRMAEFCARCHSDAGFMKRFNPQARVDQLTEYRTSIHGIRNASGDPVPATCIDCHDNHGIRSVSSPDSPVYAANVPATCGRCHADEDVMAPYGIPTNQYEDYRRSVHAATLIERGDLAAPACNDCHGNHGAVPPGVKSVANVCGQCHGREASLFRKSFKKELFDDMGVGECTVCHRHHRILHPTPELFHSDSEATVTKGTITETDPFEAHLGNLEEGETATATWRVALAPYMERGDERLVHRIEVSANGIQPVFLDATVRPGDLLRSPDLPRRVETESFVATLGIEGLSGVPVKGGDALLLQLDVEATAAVQGLAVLDLSGEGIDAVEGSACLTCHERGGFCDEETERMYGAIGSLDRALRHAGEMLHEAEVAGMEVSGPQFDLKSKGITAAVEARALVHTFDPDRLIKRADEGMQIAGAAQTAAEAALAELQNRRKGLAVALVLIGVLLVGLYAKIRQVARTRRGQPSVRGASPSGHV